MTMLCSVCNIMNLTITYLYL